MNVLIHLIAVLLTTWATWWFLEHNMTVIAVGLAGIVLLLVLWLVQSLFEDVGDTASGFRERRKGRQGRE